jgi:hypothetical protein
MDASAPVSGGALALSPALVGGRRHKLKLVTKKKARKALKKLGLKIRGGAGAPDAAAVALPDATLKAAGMDGGADMPEVPAPPMAGRRGGKKTKKRSASRRRSSIFGL